ncbi:hypothetical protein [Paeniglutamicibacter gangotriensis]|uniref:Uncharacterized protein n=1 Tax=Paeniglutamicibacter gangotriensis Lz1y TaxID=1276920 RepID=M7MTK0_9MICC|nr:hypothetical protein [Paeniglutamicibacter gangotriensis]EMQ98356.1 hypothetical protein ADIAG_02375 [Paeniglutamicibacter gangotriensis Lz1y]
MTECTHCEADLPAGLTLCNTGADDLRRILSRVRSTLNTAGGTLTNTAVAPAPIGGGGGGQEAPGLPYSVDMSDRVRDYQEAIRYWAGMIGEAQGKPAPVDTIAAGMFLRAHIGLIRGNEHANTILQELRAAERSVINAADRQAPKLLLGECGAPVWEEHTIVRCAGQIIGREGDDQAKCDTCRSTHSARERIEAKISRAWHVLAPLPQIIRALKAYGIHIRYDTAKKWVTRGKLAPVCDLRTRTEGYSPAAVLAVMPKPSTPIRQHVDLK